MSFSSALLGNNNTNSGNNPVMGGLAGLIGQPASSPASNLTQVATNTANTVASPIMTSDEFKNSISGISGFGGSSSNNLGTVNNTVLGGLPSVTDNTATTANNLPTENTYTNSAGQVLAIPTDTQLGTLEKAKLQNRDIGVGVVTPGLDANWWTYRDPNTGIIMKTKDKAVADYAVTRPLNTTVIDPSVNAWDTVGTIGNDIDWTKFGYNDINDYVLKTGNTGIIGGAKTGSTSDLYSQLYGNDLVHGVSTSPYVIGQQGNSVDPYSGYTPYSYTDTSLNDAVNLLDKTLYNSLYTTNYMGGNTTLNNARLDPSTKSYFSGRDAVDIGRTGVSYLDALNDTYANKALEKISLKTGIPIADLESAYQNWHYANQTYFEPTVANWQNAVNSPGSEDILAGIGQYTNLDKALGTKTTKQDYAIKAGDDPIKVNGSWIYVDPTTGVQMKAKDETTAKSLASGEYKSTDTFLSVLNNSLNTKTVANTYDTQDFGIKAGDEPLKLDDTHYAVIDKNTGKQVVTTDINVAKALGTGTAEGITYDEKTGKYIGANPDNNLSAEFYAFNKPSEMGRLTTIDKAMDWSDYLPSGVTLRDATPEQVTSAKDTYKAENELLGTWIDPKTLSNVGTTVTNNQNYTITDPDGVQKINGAWVYQDDTSKKFMKAPTEELANLANNPDTFKDPVFYNGKYYYIDPSTKTLMSSSNPIVANTKSSGKDLSQELINATTGSGSVFNLFKSEKLPLPENFDYTPNLDTRKFNLAATIGVNPSTISSKLTPQEVYKNSITYDPPSGGIGGFIKSIAPVALSIAFPEFAPLISGLSGAMSVIKGDIIGGVMSLAGASGAFGDMTSGFTGGLSTSLQETFNLSADVANQLSRAAMFGGLGAINAAINNQDILASLATSAGAGALAGKINANLEQTITNPALRNYITGQLTNAFVNALKNNPITVAGQVIN